MGRSPIWHSSSTSFKQRTVLQTDGYDTLRAGVYRPGLFTLSTPPLLPPPVLALPQRKLSSSQGTEFASVPT